MPHRFKSISAELDFVNPLEITLPEAQRVTGSDCGTKVADSNPGGRILCCAPVREARSVATLWRVWRAGRAYEQAWITQFLDRQVEAGPEGRGG